MLRTPRKYTCLALFMRCGTIKNFYPQSDLLLVHPVVMSYLREKWKKYLAVCYFLNLGLYLLFLGCLTTFTLTVHSPLDNICKFTIQVSIACTVMDHYSNTNATSYIACCQHLITGYSSILYPVYYRDCYIYIEKNTAWILVY